MTTRVCRARTPAAFAFFRELATEYENELPADLRHSDFARQLQHLEIDYGPPNAAFVATIDESPAGCVALMTLNASAAIVKKLYVKPQYRNLGVAKALLAHLIDYSRQRKFRRLVLDTERDRLRIAYNFYLSLGFEECEPYGRVDYASPTFMELKL